MLKNSQFHIDGKLALYKTFCYLLQKDYEKTS